MKTLSLTLLLALCFACVGNVLAAESINFIQNDWKKARAEAKKQNKYLFVDAYTDWCGWCKVMDKKTFPDEGVAAYMNKNFIALKLEMEHNYGVNVAMKYRVTSFPTFLVFTPDGNLVYRISGYREVAPFLEELGKALEPARRSNYKGISTEVDLNFPDFYGPAFGTKGKKVPPDSAAVNAYLAKQKDLFSEVSYSVLVRFASQLSPQFRDHLFSNKQRYTDLYGNEDIDQAIDYVAYQYLSKAMKSQSEQDMQQGVDFILRVKNGNEAERSSCYYRINYYKNVGNWSKLAEQVDKIIGMGDVHSNSINDWAWTLYEKCDDQALLNKAIGWIQPVIESKKEYATMDTYAALLYKVHRLPEAKKYAAEAIQLGKAAGEDTAVTEGLLKKMNGEAK